MKLGSVEIYLAPRALIRAQWHALIHLFHGHQLYAQWDRRWWPFVFKYNTIWCRTCDTVFLGTEKEIASAKAVIGFVDTVVRFNRAMRKADKAKRSRTSKNTCSYE